MDREEVPFEKFFTERLRQRNISIKKIAEMTGISRAHLENIASGNFGDLPSAPYLHGYLIRLGKILDFDGEIWWEEVKNENILKKSGPKDVLPKNRFTKKRPIKFIWACAILIIAIIYLIFQFARISGKPSITLIFPAENPYTAASSELTLQGTAMNADSLSVNGDTVMLQAGGAWQKDVLLQNGLNTFAVRAKKFLGGESDIVEQVIYNEPASDTSSTNATQPATGASETSSSLVTP
jgi:cytoskeletal protein RodZ